MNEIKVTGVSIFGISQQFFLESQPVLSFFISVLTIVYIAIKIKRDVRPK